MGGRCQSGASWASDASAAPTASACCALVAASERRVSSSAPATAASKRGRNSAVRSASGRAASPARVEATTARASSMIGIASPMRPSSDGLGHGRGDRPVADLGFELAEARAGLLGLSELFGHSVSELLERRRRVRGLEAGAVLLEQAGFRQHGVRRAHAGDDLESRWDGRLDIVEAVVGDGVIDGGREGPALRQPILQLAERLDDLAGTGRTGPASVPTPRRARRPRRRPRTWAG